MLGLANGKQDEPTLAGDVGMPAAIETRPLRLSKQRNSGSGRRSNDNKVKEEREQRLASDNDAATPANRSRRPRAGYGGSPHAHPLPLTAALPQDQNHGGQARG